MSRGASGKRRQSRRMAEVKKQIQFEIGHALLIDIDSRFQRLCEEKPK